jgi:TolA-binding protein
MKETLMGENKLQGLKAEFVNEYPEFVQFLATYGRPAVTAVLVAALAVMGTRLYTAKKSSALSGGATALATARSIEDLEKVTVDFEGAPAAPLAYMMLAKAHFDSGDFDSALNKYLEFQSKFPKHPLYASVELCRINCIEARGADQEAMAQYDTFIKENEGHYLATEALFGKARCFQKANLLVEAKNIYENYIIANPRGAWAPRVEDALEEIDRQLELAASVPATK